MNENQGVRCYSCGKTFEISGSIFVVRKPFKEPTYFPPKHICRTCLEKVPAGQRISLADLQHPREAGHFDCYWVHTAGIYLDLRTGGRGWTCKEGRVLHGISKLGLAIVLRIDARGL